MKVWITKYALTQGIFEIEAEECGMGFPGMIQTKEEHPSHCHEEGKDWHRSKDSAVKRAEEMRQKKISSLRKKLEKLEKMKFE
mgnify:CR=1 FL=1